MGTPATRILRYANPIRSKPLRILIYPHDLNIGGSQINAIDLAAIHADNGHEVTIFGVEGPLVDYIKTKGLPFVAARELRYRPAPSRVAQLASVVRDRRIDIVHGYEWPPCLDAYFGAHLLLGAPLLCTVLSMEVSALVPPSIPLIMGTEQLGDEARLNRGDVRVLEPPIDVDADHPGIDGRPFRLQHKVSDNEVLIITVSRLSIELKLDALVDLIDATERLAAGYPVRLIIVGDGAARTHLEERAANANQAIGRTTVSLVGSMPDPRPAYAAADLVAGMGSSALRAMAIGKPLVVQGEGGFSLPFSPETCDTFLWQGFWGEGDGTSGTERLAGHLEALISDPKHRSQLAKYGRAVVVERFSLRRAAEVMEEVYVDVVSTNGNRPAVREVMTMASRAALLELKQHQPSEKRKRTSVDQSRLESAARLRGQGRR